MSNEQPARPVLRVGFVPGVTLTKWRTIWQERFPRVPLEVQEVPQAEQRTVLDQGEVDLCFARLPLDTDELHLIRLYDEVPVVWAAKDHAVAAVEDVGLEDLADEDCLTEVTAHAIDLVAIGEAVLLVPMSVARSQSRRDLVYRPIRDAEPTTVGLAWKVDNPNELIAEFIGIVRGRTANSSRTTRERGAAAPKKPAKAPKSAPPSPRGRSRGRRTR